MRVFGMGNVMRQRPLVVDFGRAIGQKDVRRASHREGAQWKISGFKRTATFMGSVLWAGMTGVKPPELLSE